MDKHVEMFRVRRGDRLNKRGFRYDDEEEENGKTGGTKGKRNGGHGNTRLPYGLAREEGIDTKGMTPKDVWNALEGKGYSAKESYKGLKEGKHGKSLKGSAKEEKPKSVFKTEEEFNAVKKKVSDGILKMDRDSREMARAKDNYERYAEWLEKAEAYKAYANGRTIEELRARSDEIYNEYRKTSGFDTEKIKALRKEYTLCVGAETELDRRGKDFGIASYKASIENEQRKIKQCQEDMDYIDNSIKDDKEAIRSYVETKFPTWDDCKSIDDIQEKLDSNFYFVAGRSSKLTGCDVVASKASMKVLSKLYDDFPQLKGKLGALDVDTMSRSSFGYSYDDYRDGVRLCTRLFGSEETVKKQYDHCVAIGFHCEGTGYDSVISHEYTHQIDGYLTELGVAGKTKSGVNRKFSSYVVSKALKSLKMDRKTAIQGISSYAGKNTEEFLAEAYSEYRCSKTPRPVAMEVGKIVDEALNNLKEK